MDLSATISITDNLTAPLRNMANAVNTISSNLKALENNSDKLDSKKLESMNQATKVLDTSMKALEGSTRQTASVVTDETGKLGANKKAADSLSLSLKDIESNANKSFNQAGQGADMLSGRLSGLVKTAIATATAFATIGAGKALWGAANSVAEFGDNIDKTSQKIGISAESYQEWDYVFQRCGASVDNLQLGMKTLSSVIADAGSGSTEAADKLAKVGLSVDDLNNKSQDEQLSIVISRLQEMGSGAQRTSAATDLLGRSATDMAAVLNMSAEETEALKQETRDYGMVMSNEGVKAAATFEDSLTRLKSTFTGIKNGIIGDFTPALTSAMDSLSGFGAELGQRIRESMSAEEFQSGMTRLQEALENLAPKIQDMAAGLTERIPDILNSIVGAFNWFIDNGDRVGAVLSALGGAFLAYRAYSFVSGIITSITTATQGLSVAQALLNTVMSANPIGILITLLGALAGAVIYLWNTNEGFRDSVTGAWQAIVGAFQNAWNNISGIFESFNGGWEEAKESIERFWTGTCQTVSGWWEGAKEWGSNLIEGFKSGLLEKWQGITDWFTEKFSWVINFVKGIFGIASPSTVFADIGSNLLAGLYNGITGFWGTITGWFTDTVLPFFSSIGDTIAGLFGNLFGGGEKEEAPEIEIPDYSAVIEQTKQAFSELEITVNTIVTAIVNNLVLQTTIGIQNALAAYTDFGDQISRIFSGIIAIVASGMAEISSTIAGETGIATAFSSVFEGARVIAIEILTRLNADALSVINALIRSINTTLPAGFSSAWAAVQSVTLAAIASLKNSTLGALSGFIGAVNARIDQLPAHFRSAGAQMMRDLNAGINSQKQSVIDTTSALVEQIKQVFITGLGIHSPSHFTEYVGEMMAAGLFKGLTNAQIQSFVESVVGNMKSAFEGGSFDPMQLVKYLDDDTLKLIEYLNVTGDKTTSEKAADNNMIAYPLVGTRGTQTSWFGHRESPGGIGSTNHQGADLASPTGTPIASALAGTVITAGWYGGYGNAVVVDSGGGLSIVYGHMSSVGASVGQQVQKGQQIGLVGSTGNSTGPHLHFEIRQNGSAIDPQPYLDGAAPLAGVPNTLAGSIQQAYNQYKGITTPGGSSNLGNIAFDVSAGVEQWRPLVIQALNMLGEDPNLASGVLYGMEHESSGNPNAINDWDSNAAAGIPSKGLMQVIDPTFQTYAVPGYDTNIWDPLSNILASLNYMKKAKGGIAKVISDRAGGWYGYAKGTRNAAPGLHWVGEKGPELLYFQGGETVIPHQDSVSLIKNLNYAYPLSSTVEAQSLAEGLNLNFGSVENTEPSVTEPILDRSESYQVQGGTTNNTPITLNFSPTIHTSEQFDVSMQQVENAILEILNEVSAKGAEGLYEL